MKSETMKPGEVTAMLGISRGKLREMREAAPGMAVRLPGFKQWRYVRREVERLAKAVGGG